MNYRNVMQVKEFYSLRQVADLTGLSEFTLRGWEGRYGAFAPKRSDTGRRQYRPQDLRKAFLLRELTDNGHRISDIALLNIADLEKKLDQHLASHQDVQESVNTWTAKLMKMVYLQDWDSLSAAITKNLRDSTPLKAVHDTILPLLKELGLAVAEGRLSIAQEHILSAIVKEHIYLLITQCSNKTKSNHAFIVATPEGDHHEIGILIAHLLLKAHGIKSLFLGPNTPKKDLCETAIRFGASHILLASTVDTKGGAREDIFSFLHYLDVHLPPSLSIWVGGRNAISLNLGFKRSLRSLGGLHELPELITALKKTK